VFLRLHRIVMYLSQESHARARKEFTRLQVLTAAIMAEEEKTRVLRERASGNAFYGVQDSALAQLAAKVLEVYGRCGFDNDASVGTLQMLTNFEVSGRVLRNLVE
jgi:hypothetical protein